MAAMIKMKNIVCYLIVVIGIASVQEIFEDWCAGCSAGNIVGIKISCSGMVAGTESNSCDGKNFFR